MGSKCVVVAGQSEECDVGQILYPRTLAGPRQGVGVDLFSQVGFTRVDADPSRRDADAPKEVVAIDDLRFADENVTERYVDTERPPYSFPASTASVRNRCPS